MKTNGDAVGAKRNKPLHKFTIYGERCSGTNYLERLIENNFEASVTWEYGWKHFFGFDQDKLKGSGDTLFICIVRDIDSWMNSFFRNMYHLPLKYKKIPMEDKKTPFLNDEIWSFDEKIKNYSGNKFASREILEDRNMYTGNRYQNIFELRHTKLKYMMEDLPNKVRNCILIRYEDLINDFENTMIKIKDKGLSVKKGIAFPLNTFEYKKSKRKLFTTKTKVNYIERETILNNPHLQKYYETKLKYL
uniref:Uncharacterized protein n=1 Tax=viral metagenome TaxID=1070528 RepID=A0A6C0LM63_9ZZZZ